jgi:UDP-N-acetylenolpyruvoylglucosamine reductase
MNNNTNQIKEFFGLGLHENIPISKMTTLKIGGPARYFIEANNSHDLIDYIIKCRQNKLPFLLIGGGTNILVGDKGFNGMVIKNNTRNYSICAIKGNIHSQAKEKKIFIKSESGVPFNQLVRFTVEEGLSGLEMHLGLPGTVGGAVYMNAKWMHPKGFVGSAVYQATILTPDNQIKVVPKSYFKFEYGRSVIQESGDILIDVTFILSLGNKAELWKIANQSIDYRRKTQPQGVSSAGCIFKNISLNDSVSHHIPGNQTSAGFLIDSSGMKNQKQGDAVVSEVHANFILNLGKANASDVVKLIQLMKEKVKNIYGVDLAEEVIRVGDF